MQDSLSYRDAGVDIDAGNKFVDRIKKHIRPTIRPEVLNQLGGFGAFFEIPTGYKNPVMVSCTDGVGTKLKLALELNRHDTIGIDCVAMCVNDCVVSGAEPLWFLDYLATGKLDLDIAEEVIKGMTQGCLESGMSLIGGETAEMPGMYAHQDYDIAGFCVGIVEKSKIIDGQTIQAGDKLIALPSSGVHSNGFSLVRKMLLHTRANLHQPFGHTTLGEALLEPTRLYVKQTLKLAKSSLLKGAAHITGGGLTENIPRMLPSHLGTSVDLNAWERPALFHWLQQAGKVSPQEMLTTFNCGLGMIYIVAPDAVHTVLSTLQSLGEHPILIGEVNSTPTPVQYKGSW